ncbi:MAG: hypothetical protein ACRDTD_31035, partial [Pseudonocardiaceae bacterium]
GYGERAQGDEKTLAADLWRGAVSGLAHPDIVTAGRDERRLIGKLFFIAGRVPPVRSALGVPPGVAA